MRRLICVVAVLLTGCNSISPESPSTPAPVAESTPVISPRKNQVPRELKLKLTLDDPADLKVKQEDSVRKGQVLSDRTSARKTLEQQRQTIRLKLKHLKASAGVGSSQVSYAVEQARVRQAQVRVKQAKEAIAQFKTHSPWTDHAWASLPLDKELAQVTQLEGKMREAEAELDLAAAQLQTVREKQPVGQDTSVQRLLLLSQLRDVEARLAGVGTVRSPYAGIVKKIKWVGQIDQVLQAELTLAAKELQNMIAR